MLHILLEVFARELPARVPEPEPIMDDVDQAGAYATQGQGFLAPMYLYHAIQASALIRPGDKVLDLACGPGNQLVQLAGMNPDAQFIGIDASERMLGLARQTLDAHQVRNVGLLPGTLPSLAGIETASADVVICTMALHHLQDTTALVETFHEIRRVLKPHGRVYIADFGRLKRIRTQRYLAGQNKEQPEVFRTDYFNSLRAAFSVDEFASAGQTVFGDRLELKHTHKVPLFMALVSRQRAELCDRQQGYAQGMYGTMARAQRSGFRDIARFFWQGGYPLAFRPR